MFKAILLTFAAALVITGCVNRETDPRKVNVFESALNQSDGTNDQRLADKQARNQTQAQINAEEQQRTAALQEEESRLRSRVDRTKRKIASLDSRIGSAKAKVSKSSARYAELLAAEKKLKTEKTALRRAEASGDGDEVLIRLRNVGLIQEEYDLTE